MPAAFTAADDDVTLLLPLALGGGPPPPPKLPLVVCLNLEADEGCAVGEFSWLPGEWRGGWRMRVAKDSGSKGALHE